MSTSPANPQPTVYLDHAATTPLSPVARQAWLDAAALEGNASALHTSGRAARNLVEESRERIARAVNCEPHEVVFTSGGTEADNLAVKGLYWQRTAQDPRRRRIIIGAGEHHAVLDPAEWLEQSQDAEVFVLPADAVGRVDLNVLREEIERDPGSVALVSIMAANNEIGTLQPVAEAARVAAEHGIPLHTDAVQALGWTDLDFAASGATAMSVTGHKIGGPVGAGALILRRGATAVPVEHGGGQERQVRSGTLNVAGIAGFAAAAQDTVAHRDETRARVRALRDQLIEGVTGAVPEARLMGDPDPAGRLDSNAHFVFSGCEGDSLLYLLDAAGVEASTGSACSAGVPQASHVLLATGIPESEALGALRFSLGPTSTQKDVDTLVEAIGPAIHRARSAGLAAAR